jgi:hypothetical protein
MILTQVVYSSDIAPESESSDKDGVSDNLSDDNCEGLTLDMSSNNGIALDSASEVEGDNLGSKGE